MSIILWISLVVLLVLAGLIVFVPRYYKWKEARQKEYVEDALKHLLGQEQQGLHATVSSLGGSLNLNPTKSMQLLESMESQGLVETRGADACLTPEGERWALHVVRAHRLWERYLADEARMPLEKVHGEAHRREHNLTDAQLDALDASLGHPIQDPHGDPIPKRDGSLAASKGKPLTSWAEGIPTTIIHIEDEPAIAYAQITAEGLRLGQTIRILEKSPERYILTDGENEYRLAPAVAANITAESAVERIVIQPGTMPLAELMHNHKAEIIYLDDSVQGFTRRRFLDLGLTPGTTIYPELKNFFGDPRGYRIRGTLIALRKEQAAKILVKTL
jgi:DtxR family transcriptional regulator, Mn-dependent transcriptional regulator